MYMVAVDNMPLRTPERKGFKVFVKKLQPLYHLPSEPTLIGRLTKKYQELKQLVMTEMEEADSVCLTTDIWTHKHTMQCYIGITAHYLKGKLYLIF